VKPANPFTARSQNSTQLLAAGIVCWVACTAPAAGVEPWQGVTHPPRTDRRYFLHTGFTFEAVLRTAVFSYNLETPVIAETEYDVIFRDRVVLPRGTTFIGYASVLKTDNRVNLLFHTAVFPDGSEIPLSGLALDRDGAAGIPGEVRRHRETVPARVVLEAAANVAAPGVGAAIVKQLTQESARDLSYRPTYSVSVKRHTPIQIYVVNRTEY
jgi:hypothetical protein